MSFSEKYRPTAFEHVIGKAADRISDDIIKKTMSDNPPQCWLFTGGTGSGKTTFAKILASRIPNAEIISINCSDANGVETARSIIENIKYPPLGYNHRVYILDEVQRTSKAYQNTLLDPMEKLPSYASLIFCTTEPDSLLDTFKRRCLIYNMEPPSVSELTEYLQYIADKEGKAVNKNALRAIAKGTECSIGWSLSVLEAICDFPEPEQEGKLKAIIATRTSNKDVRDLCKALLAPKSWDVIIQIISALNNDYEGLRYGVLNYMASIMLSGNKVQEASNIILEFEDPFTGNDGKAKFINACYLCRK